MAGGKAPGGSKGGGPYEAELPLDLGDRLPWLEGDEEGERDASTGRMIAALIAVIALLGLAGGGFWYFRHRQQEAAMVLAGGVIKAPPGPYKVRPTDAGGAIAPGTGDTAFRVAQGKSLGAPVAAGARGVDLAGPAAPASGSTGVGVQLGAFSGQDEAERAWPALEARFPMLAGLHHRVIEMPGDLGSVYGLQAVAENAAGADALCQQLRAGGLKCQVRE
jgi:SPOR domain